MAMMARNQGKIYGRFSLKIDCNSIMVSECDPDEANDDGGLHGRGETAEGTVAAVPAVEDGAGDASEEGPKAAEDDDKEDGPPAKRARTHDEDAAAASQLDDLARSTAAPPLPGVATEMEDATNSGGDNNITNADQTDVNNQEHEGNSYLDVQQAVLKYKRKKGTTYDVIYDDEEPAVPAGQQQKGGENAFGIKIAAIKVKNAHSFLIHFFEVAFGEKYRGRPPTASDQAIVVESIVDTAPAKTKMSVQRNDVLLFIDDKLVNITDKKRLKYYRARLNNSTRPMKLTFFRPSEGVEELDDEEMELDPSEALYVTKYEPAGCLHIPASKQKASTVSTLDDRQARRAVLERRLEEFESLHAETSAELKELRAQDGLDEISEAKKLNKTEKPISVKGDEAFVIPSHIMYYPPMKLRRKKVPALNEACNKVENLLRHRTMIDNEADKIRGVVKQGQRRLDLKDKELEALDEKMAPALEQVKLIEMEVQDNWKAMYLKLKDYYEEKGHSNVMEKEDSKLSKWITRQRTCYANAQLDEPNTSVGIIKPYQYDLLNRINFCWNPREQQFIQNVAMLRAYKEEHGHTNVPMKYHNIHLANFVQKWRREHRLFQEGKPSNMSQDRLQVLEGAGFTWRDPSRTRKRSDTRQETWDGFMSQLHDFYVKYGHFMVNKVNKTLEKGSRLGRLDEFCGWVRKQYTLYKEGSPCQLTDEKVNQLKEMGFWLERGQAHRYSNEQRAASSPQKEAAVQLGQLHIPKIDDVADNDEMAEEAASEGEDGDTVDATTMV